MNAGIQGLAADLFKVALIRLDAGLEEGGLASDLVLQVHDEVLVDVEPDEADAGGRPHRGGPDRSGRARPCRSRWPWPGAPRGPRPKAADAGRARSPLGRRDAVEYD